MDNYTKVYVKTYGSAPSKNSYVFNGGLSYNKWKGTTPNSNRTTYPININSNAATSSCPQLNGANSTATNPRAFRGLSSYPPNSGGAGTGANKIIGRYNGLYTTARGNGIGRSGSLNPIKHWRKQLQPSQGHITGKPTLNSIMWQPGGTTVLKNTNCTNGSYGVLSSYLNEGVELCTAQVIRNELSNFQPVIINNPQRITRPKSSQTLIKKNYYTTSKSYLKSRAKLYIQNQTLSKIGDNGLNQLAPPANNNWVYPENSQTQGTQVYNTTFFADNLNNDTCRKKVIFKPNNPFFAVQGAVDSSTKIVQSKYEAINKNNYNFNLNVPNQIGLGLNVYSIAGDKTSPIVRLPGSRPVKYRGDSYGNAAPYFIKSKYQAINACAPGQARTSTTIRAKINSIGHRMPSGGAGLITTCFYNPVK
jgi:hypothetical protein